ncbi:very short patch repair endonuclease, partial [Dolichospermum sp. ST_sed10]|nr:very short patch repair endonuclease [Dolichospermum sp. ST_sed10]
ANCKPDFIYKDEKTAIFCDGSVHDSPEQKKQDQIERDNLKYNAGYQTLILRYDDNWREKLEVLKSL